MKSRWIYIYGWRREVIRMQDSGKRRRCKDVRIDVKHRTTAKKNYLIYSLA